MKDKPGLMHVDTQGLDDLKATKEKSPFPAAKKKGGEDSMTKVDKQKGHVSDAELAKMRKKNGQ